MREMYERKDKMYDIRSGFKSDRRHFSDKGSQQS